MRTLIASALALLLGSTASASPWFDRAEAEQLVSTTLPHYYQHMQEHVRDADVYDQRLVSGVGMSLKLKSAPEVVEAFDARWQAQLEYLDALARYRAAASAGSSPSHLPLLRAAENNHRANLELMEHRQVMMENQLDLLYTLTYELADELEERSWRAIEPHLVD